MKKVLAAILALTVFFTAGMFGMTVSAASGSTSNKPRIEEVDYKGSGKVEVDFYGKISYNKVKVTAKDTSGKSHSAKIIEKDNDEITFKINNAKSGKTYKFTISGIKVKGTSGYTSVSGSVKTPSSSKVLIKKTSYKGSSKVEVDFAHKVSYKNAKVTVKDSGGKSYSASVTSKKSDELKFKVSGIKAGKTYTFKISGIKNRSANSYTSVSGKFKTPSQVKVTIREIEYDFDDKELSVEFNGKVNYKNTKVTVTDSNGKSYSATILEKDRDEMEIRVKGLKRGGKYTLKISGVKHVNASSYTTMTKSFYAYDD